MGQKRSFLCVRALRQDLSVTAEDVLLGEVQQVLLEIVLSKNMLVILIAKLILFIVKVVFILEKDVSGPILTSRIVADLHEAFVEIHDHEILKGVGDHHIFPEVTIDERVRRERNDFGVPEESLRIPRSLE